MISESQATYLSNYIQLKKSGEDFSKLGTSLMGSKISLNPHQIDAALAFFKTPFQKGLILADEVGLGKTIEAGLVISQYWYEKKRKILIISPASLMKQWNEELYEKFFLESTLLSSKQFKSADFKWEDKIYITSLHSIYLNKELFNSTFDLVVIDEAHKLRNVYKSNGVMAPAIKEAFAGTKKLMLTATPFQNNLLELFGLISIIDDEIFGDVELFKSKYINNYNLNKEDLHSILEKYIVRTLRKDVVKYIKYTKRLVEVFEYESTLKESQFYEMVSSILYSDDFLESYFGGQNQLLIILLQKLLSSSSYAVCKTLTNMKYNLQNKELLVIDDIENDEEEKIIANKPNININNIIKNIDKCLEFSKTITIDSKYESLKKAIDSAFELLLQDSSRNKKILIFTESKQTQEYLAYRLKNDGYDKILSFNGENNSKEINNLYCEWLEKTDQISSNVDKSINVRRAIIDAFENQYEILIATDAAAEGLNMQFCSIMINYDLPWNPQKIEQRIGRCHRYGQKNDVIVMNMLNKNSSIDNRIYTLLNTKLGIFEETFGSSDLILGNTNIAEDIELRIKKIYTSCRTPEEINEAFEEMQKEFDKEIKESLKISEDKLEQYFDEEVQRSFDLQYVEATKLVNEYEIIFWELLKYTYFNDAKFNENDFTFKMEKSNENYYVSTQKKNLSNYHYCSLNSELGQRVLLVAKNRNNLSKNTLDYTNSNAKIGFIDNTENKSGQIVVSKVTYNSFELTESLVLSGRFDDGTIIPGDICHKLLKLECAETAVTTTDFGELNKRHNLDIDKTINEIELRNENLFRDESEYINSWADNQIESIQVKVKEMREKRKILQMDFNYEKDILEKERIQSEIHKLSKKISQSWISLAEAEDQINERRNNLMVNLSKEKKKEINIENLISMEFIIR